MRRVAARTGISHDHCIPPKKGIRLWETSSLNASRRSTGAQTITLLRFQARAPLDAHALSPDFKAAHEIRISWLVGLISFKYVAVILQ